MIGTTGNGGDDGTLLLAMRPALPYIEAGNGGEKRPEGVFSVATLQLRISCSEEKPDCVQKEAVRCEEEEVEGEIKSEA